jgi:transposase
MTDKPIVGIDVSKGWLDASVAGSARVERIANDSEAVGAWLDRVGPGLVAFEPTGGYERILAAAVRERSVPFIRVHPNDVIAFRKSRGVKANSNPIDARLILAFVSDELSRRGWRSSVIGDDRLRALAARRRQLIEVLQAERCRLSLAALLAVRDSLEQVIAALLGLAPHTRRGGTIRYREPTGHGRAGLRHALFNAARAAIRHPSPFRDFYDRLVGQNRRPGKSLPPAKAGVALTAVMRQLVITTNAVARDRQPWRGTQPKPQPRAGGTKCRPHGEPIARRAGRVKAATALRAVAPRASLDAV